MQHISQILPRVLEKYGLKADADASVVLMKATTWLRERLGELGEDVRASTLVAAVLTVEVASPIAAQECHALHRDLVASLRREVPNVKVERVRIVRARNAR